MLFFSLRASPFWVWDFVFLEYFFFFCWWDLELLVGVRMQWLTLSQGPTLAKCWGEICCSPGIKCVSFVILVKPQTTITDRYWFSIAVIKLASEGLTAPEHWSFYYLSQQPFFLSPNWWIINLVKLKGLLTHTLYHTLSLTHMFDLCDPFFTLSHVVKIVRTEDYLSTKLTAYTYPAFWHLRSCMVQPREDLLNLSTIVTRTILTCHPRI